jgi:hypothetical protein
MGVIAGEFHGFDARDQLVEERTHLHAREHCTKAVVNTETKSKVSVWCATNIKLERVSEGVLVTVTRWIREKN